MPQNDSIITSLDSLSPDAQKAVRQVMDSLNNVSVINTQAPGNPVDPIIKFLSILCFVAFLFIVLIFWQQGLFSRLKNNKYQFVLLLIAAFICLIPAIGNNLWLLTGALFLGIIIMLRMLVRVPGNMPEHNEVAATDEDTTQKKLTYEGKQLNFSIPTIHETLNKHWPYFSTLEASDKDKFGDRLKQFMDIKTYDIYDENGFMEMPILISAAAIQITFGLNDFLLSDFPVINIYPDAFFRSNPFPRFLEGNVSNNCINLSWKHFLQGINCYTDGDNVGLHEMAHALYSHEFIQKMHADNFCKTYEEFNDYGTKIFSEGKTADDDLYCDYAFRNIQEFWAVSIELFFERSDEMKVRFPSIYNAITDILNQDPANKITVLRSA